MKITGIECIPVQAPGRTLVPIVVETDAGLTGVGEAGLQRRWKGIQGALEHIQKWLVGEDPMRIDYLWQRMFRGGFYPGDRLIGSVISGIDIALWDIKGQALGVPVYELLGGRCRDHVEVFTQPGYVRTGAVPPPGDLLNMALTKGDPQATAELAAQCLDAGHKFFRLGPVSEGNRFDARRSIALLIDQLKAVRAKVGARMELMVDIHTRFSPDEAIWFCREAEPLRLFCVEDPIRSEHMAGYHHLRRHVHVPLAAGEQWAHKWEFREAIENELADYIRPDLCICGGLTEGKKIAAIAEAHLIKLLPHNPLGPICTAASLHLDLACDNAGPQEVLFPPERTLPDVFQCAFEIRDHKLTVPTAPGLGVKFNRDAAKKYPAEMTEPPHFHRADGSFTNY